MIKNNFKALKIKTKGFKFNREEIYDECFINKFACEVTMENIKSGDLFQHFKGNQYKIVALARYSENPEQIFVVYQALYESPIYGKDCVWVRPLNSFLETIVRDGKEIKRFNKIS